MPHWPQFDADLTLLSNGKLLVGGPLGLSTASPRQVVVFGVVTQPPSVDAPQGTWVVGEVKLAPGGGDGMLPLENGMWHFTQAPTPGRIVEGPALANALRVEMTQNGSIATFGWSQWLTIRKAAARVSDDDARLLAGPLMAGAGFPERFADVQPNIIRPHARDSLHVRLLRFDDPQKVREVLRNTAADDMKTAAVHHDEVETFHRENLPSNRPYIGIGLSRSGYAKLGRTPPADPAFTAGMRARRDLLGDPGDDALEPGYREPADAIVLVAWPVSCIPNMAHTPLDGRFDSCTTVLAQEDGLTIPTDGGEPTEHFGFADGISGPRFIVDPSRPAVSGPWNPVARLGSVLVREPEGPGFGSYLVYRKLRQDPDAFMESTRQVATALWNDPDRAGYAGALLFGRHGDGTPTMESSSPSGLRPPSNGFDYSTDPGGLRCPVGAHIRRMEERDGNTPVLARRGQTYGKPDGSGDVGVLFMAVMASIERQFEAVQQRANDPASFDALIGQANGERPASTLPAEWGQGAPTAVATSAAIDLRGGEYFFLPSVSFLRDL